MKPFTRQKRPAPRVRVRPKLGTPEFLNHGFKDQRSHVVTRTGRVVLRGMDKTDLRLRVFRRAGGRCEVLRNGERCNRYAPWDGFMKGDLSHTVHRSRGGSDVESNVLWSCQRDHGERHLGPQFASQRRRTEERLSR